MNHIIEGNTECSLQYYDAQHGSGIGEDVYDGAATVGKVTSTVYLVCAVVIAILLCISGYFCIFKNDDSEWADSTAVVETATCTKQTTVDKESGSTSTTYNCGLTVNYKVGDKLYTGKPMNTNGSTQYVKGSILAINYKISNPEEIKTDSVASSTIGYALSGCAILIILAAGANWYMTKNSKMYAAASGASTVVGTVSDMF